jgi:hypothetical protein
MIILLRQSNIKVGTPNDHSLTLAEAGFIWVKYLEVFDDRIEFMPLGQQDYEPTAIKKVLVGTQHGNHVRTPLRIPFGVGSIITPSPRNQT